MKIMLKKIAPPIITARKDSDDLLFVFPKNKNKFTRVSFSPFRRKLGMTLIELLIAIVISGIVLSIVFASFASIVKINHKLNLQSQLQKEGTYALSRMADQIRSESINYEAYEAGSGSACANENKKSTTTLCVGNTAFTLKDEMMFQDGAPLFSKSFAIKKAIFHISPEKNPKTNYDTKSQRQPLVNINLEIVSREANDINLQIQTSISSRKYE